VAIALQSALRAVWQPLGFIRLCAGPGSVLCVAARTAAGFDYGGRRRLALDLISGPPALLGAGGFAKVLTAYAFYFVASRRNA